jgi:proliferating cell nuclear antigen PCNA
MSVKLTTDQGDRLRTAFETMRDFVSEAKFVFGPAGLELVGQDYANVVLVRYTITAAKLKETGGSYAYDSKDPIVAGVNPKIIASCLKCSAPGDTVSLEIDPKIPNRIIFRCFNGSKNSRWEIVTPELAESQDESTDRQIGSEDLVYSGSVTMASNAFHDMIRDLSTTEATVVTVKCDATSLALSADGFMSKASFEICAEATFERKDADSSAWPISVSYALVFLQRVAKAKNISSHITMHLRRDYPMAVVYDSPVGPLVYVIAPRDESSDDSVVISQKQDPNKKRKIGN